MVTTYKLMAEYTKLGKTVSEAINTTDDPKAVFQVHTIEEDKLDQSFLQLKDSIEKVSARIAKDLVSVKTNIGKSEDADITTALKIQEVNRQAIVNAWP